jgi:hypothetical protein
MTVVAAVVIPPQSGPITDIAPLSSIEVLSIVFSGCASHYRRLWLFLITQQFSLRVPDLQTVPVDYVMNWTQGFGGFERRFEGLKHLHGMAAVSRDAKRSV